MNKPLYKKGEIIICPTCSDKIATLNIDIFSGMKLSELQVTGLQQEITHGQPMTCTKCGSNYFNHHAGSVLTINPAADT